MKKVVIIKTFDSAASEMKYSGRVILSEDGTITFEGLSAKFVEEMNTFGAVGLGRDGILHPEDGAAFLDALREQCGRCTMVRASEPIDT